MTKAERRQRREQLVRIAVASIRYDIPRRVAIKLMADSCGVAYSNAYTAWDNAYRRLT